MYKKKLFSKLTSALLTLTMLFGAIPNVNLSPLTANAAPYNGMELEVYDEGDDPPDLSSPCDSIGHLYSEWVVINEPSCENPGWETRVCQRKGCGMSDGREIEPQGEHDVMDWRVMMEPTCRREGTEYGLCLRCYEMIIRDVPTSPHDIVWTEILIEPNCTRTGTGRGRCSFCENTFYEIPMLPHESNNWTVTTPPSCESVGLELGTCRNCYRNNVERDVPALGHDYQLTGTIYYEPTCTVAGYGYGRCSRCDRGTWDVPIPALGHDYRQQEVIPPDCTNSGWGYLANCSGCNADYPDNPPAIVTFDALGHDYNTEPAPTNGEKHNFKCERCPQRGGETDCTYQFTVTKNASCTEDGEVSRKCTVCNGINSENSVPIEKIGHDFPDGCETTCKRPDCYEKSPKCGICEICDPCGYGLHEWASGSHKGDPCEFEGCDEPYGGDCGSHTCAVCGIICNLHICDDCGVVCGLHICDICETTCNLHVCADCGVVCNLHVCAECNRDCNEPDCPDCGHIANCAEHVCGYAGCPNEICELHVCADCGIVCNLHVCTVCERTCELHTCTDPLCERICDLHVCTDCGVVCNLHVCDICGTVCADKCECSDCDCDCYNKSCHDCGTCADCTTIKVNSATFNPDDITVTSDMEAGKTEVILKDCHDCAGDCNGHVIDNLGKLTFKIETTSPPASNAEDLLAGILSWLTNN